MNWSNWIRRFHRALALAFTAGFLVNLLIAARGIEPPFWVYLLALVPLFLLLPSGLWMFVQPYAARWSGRRRAGGEA